MKGLTGFSKIKNMETSLLEKIWEKTLAQVQLIVSPANFATWFGGTKVSQIKDNEIVIEVPNSFVKEWLEQKFSLTLLKIIRETYPQIKKITFEVSSQKKGSQTLLEKKISPQLELIEENFDFKTNLNQKYTFENYVVGSFNELAFAASQAVIEKPGKIYNPLFVYAGVGLGKTHLLQAIGNEIVKKDLGLKVKYLPCESLVSQIVNGLKKKDIEKLREDYEKVDVLIVDDVQILSGKEKTQEEFFFIFNHLYQREKQIVISSDRPPREILHLAQRLKSRFEGGMIVDIGEPDFESRLAILKLKMKEKGELIKEEVLEFLAENIKKNIRELEGALNFCILWQKKHKKSIDLEKVKESLKKFIEKPKAVLNFTKVIKTVCEFYQIKEQELLSSSRKFEVLKPRQVAMYLLRKELNLPFTTIARSFKGKDHTTVIHAVHKIQREYEKNVDFKWEIDSIKSRLYS